MQRYHKVSNSVNVVDTNTEISLPSRVEIVVMTPDRFWCQGVKQIIQNSKYESLMVHFCHSLNEMTMLLKGRPSVFAVLTEEYGDGENILDWSMFSNWVKRHCPMLKMVMLRPADRPGVDITSHRKRKGYLDMMSSLRDLERLFRTIKNGCLSGGEIPVWEPVLSVRELYILKCLCHAESPKRLGKRMGVNVKTISTHKTKALRKLGMKRIAPLLGRYRGLISIQETYISECSENQD
ncbi:LuxR C-terminal-related transcriptional regulator [Lelliottia sp. V106_10]|uniref:LuxR C-terminal-related transcriptional regulator n=1 Tax=Lelliottia wanjuensis TaxID=3050585 RepID=UPI00254A72D4|nr:MULTISPECIES: LuxR C-terminal-related transcriptional regulator [unclassified Lelliottia]MDK9358867.1 LuxR C-terminal-related transcriptional regulator [Lelliottia sp. V106_16]MDK9373554.1 LuxR C-terminal-related transcriptional regulator [Lelliottia sp. V106_10]MDK9600405.1 LuxR C-terminal-related transcriptional regulator [Lelliottia sp. V106_5]